MAVIVMLLLRSHLHHRTIITMSQKMKLLPIALGLLSLASVNALAAEALSLQGKTIGVAVVGT
ncbi:ABC-type sugar transport system [Klebsiella oxytoca]|nr:ABC-type sugar transport system [Klebsiella oxytoca]